MYFPDVLKALNQASAFERYRMRAAIDRVLDEPRRLLAIQSRLQIVQIGQRIISTLRPTLCGAGKSLSYAASRQ